MSSTNPGMVRKWILPILRLVVFAAIAVALAKLAFFGGFGTAGTDSAVPTGAVADPTIQESRFTQHLPGSGAGL